MRNSTCHEGGRARYPVELARNPVEATVTEKRDDLVCLQLEGVDDAHEVFAVRISTMATTTAAAHDRRRRGWSARVLRKLRPTRTRLLRQRRAPSSTRERCRGRAFRRFNVASLVVVAGVTR